MQEILWQIMNDGDQSKSASIYLDLRVPFMEVDVEGKLSHADLIKIIEKTPPPHLIKTHTHRHFFEKYTSILFVFI